MPLMSAISILTVKVPSLPALDSLGLCKNLLKAFSKRRKEDAPPRLTPKVNFFPSLSPEIFGKIFDQSIEHSRTIGVKIYTPVSSSTNLSISCVSSFELNLGRSSVNYLVVSNLKGIVCSIFSSTEHELDAFPLSNVAIKPTVYRPLSVLSRLDIYKTYSPSELLPRVTKAGLISGFDPSIFLTVKTVNSGMTSASGACFTMNGIKIA